MPETEIEIDIGIEIDIEIEGGYQDLEFSKFQDIPIFRFTISIVCRVEIPKMFVHNFN